MPTIDDLRDAFAARAQDAPRVPDLLAALPPEPAHPWRTRGAVLTGIAAVAAAVVAAVALTGTDPATHAGPPPTRAAHDVTPLHRAPVQAGPTPTRLQFAFALGSVPGYTLQYSAVEAHDQVADVYAVGRSVKSVGDIRVYSPGAYDPTAARTHGTPVTVSGHRGYWANLVDPDTTDGSGKGGTAMWAVVWEYAPNAWGVVQGDWAWEIAHGYLTGDAKQTELAVASAVDTTATHRLPVPVRLTYLPAGVVVQSSGFAPDDSQAQIGLTDGGAADPSYPGNTDTVQIQVNQYDPVVDFRKTDAHGNFRDPNQGGSTISFGRPVHVAGARAFQDTSLATVTVLYGDRYVTVGYMGTQPRRVTDAELLRIAQGIRLSPAMHDRSRWFDGLTIGP